MLGQTFELLDAPRLAYLALLEIILSADNAIVLAMLSHALPIHQRAKALWIGTLSAFAFRAGALLLISFILQYSWVQGFGGIYLLYLAARHFSKRKNALSLKPASFWKTVLLIEFFDLAFAVDSIVAALAFIGAGSPSISSLHPKLWIAYAGGMLGLFAVRYAAHIMSSLLQRFPRLETSAYLMIGWIGLKLAVVSVVTLPYEEGVFWTVLSALLLAGLRPKRDKNG